MLQSFHVSSICCQIAVVTLVITCLPVAAIVGWLECELPMPRWMKFDLGIVGLNQAMSVFVWGL